MPEYIEREAAMRHLLTHCVSRYPMSFYVGLSTAAEEIKAIPAADVVEVRRGEWVQFRLGDDDYAYRFRCSNCGAIICVSYEPEVRHYAYCHECGAKMDGKGEGE